MRWLLFLFSCCHVQLFCNPMDCRPSVSSVHGILQAKILELNKKSGHFLLQGIFPTQESNLCLLCLPHWQANSLPRRHTMYVQIISQTQTPHLHFYVLKVANPRGPGISSLQQSRGVARGQWVSCGCPLAYLQIWGPDRSFSCSLRPGEWGEQVTYLGFWGNRWAPSSWDGAQPPPGRMPVSGCHYVAEIVGALGAKRKVLIIQANSDKWG